MARSSKDRMNIDQQIDEIFQLVDELLILGSFNDIDRLLNELDVNALAVDTLIAWLTITSAAKSELRERASFVERVIKSLNETCMNCCGTGYFGLNSDCRVCGGTGNRRSLDTFRIKRLMMGLE